MVCSETSGSVRQIKHFFLRDDILRFGETRRFSVDNTIYLNVHLTKFVDIYKICEQMVSKADKVKKIFVKKWGKNVRTI